MIRNNNSTPKVDLRKKSSIVDEIKYSNLDFQSCMVVLMIMVALLLSVISVAATQIPTI